jgi:hypothetical protein
MGQMAGLTEMMNSLRIFLIGHKFGVYDEHKPPPNIEHIMKKAHISLACLGMMTTASLQAAVLAEWTFNNTSSLANALSSSSVDAGVSSVSGLQMNSGGGFGFDFAGLNNVPNSVNDGYGFGGAGGGVKVMFTHRANYFDGSGPNASSYTSLGSGASQGTAAGLGDGNAPVSFMVTAGAQDLSIDSLTTTIAAANPGSDLIVGFQEAGAAAGTTVTLNAGSSWTGTSLLASPVVIGAGQTKTFTFNLNSGALNSFHNIDEFVLNGEVVPEPSVGILLGLGTLALTLRRRR